MKKIVVPFLIMIVIFTTSTFAVEDWEKENKKREKAFQEAITELLEKYKDESVPENERITDYSYLGFGLSSLEEESLLKVHIGFMVTPYSSENTIWPDSNNFCFAEFSKVDGEYKLEWISLIPKNYDKFLERFKEYQQNETVEIEVVQGEKNEELKSGKIEEISNMIYILCYTVLSIVVISLIIKFIRKRKK